MRTAPTRFLLLAAAQLAAGVVSAPFAAHGEDFVRSETAQAVIVVGWCALSACTLLVAPRWKRWGLVSSLLGSVLLVASSALIATRGQIQVLEGFGVLVLGVLAAYVMSARSLRLFLATASTLYVAALIANRLVLGWWVAAFVIVIVVCLSELVHHQVDQLHRLARQDPLTGALNRAGLEEVAAAVRSMADRTGQPVSVAVLDLDDFKNFNDTNGHVAGDALLVELVRLWRSGLRPSDLVARLGGDEFVVVLAGSTTEQAAEVLTRLLRLSPAPWSIGIANWQAGDELLAVVDRADALMYQAKRPTPR